MTQDVEYFYMLTIRVLNPTGGRERVAAASGHFYASESIREEWKFAYAMNAARPELGLGESVSTSEAVPYPNLYKHAVLFYMCKEAGGR